MSVKDGITLCLKGYDHTLMMHPFPQALKVPLTPLSLCSLILGMCGMSMIPFCEHWEAMAPQQSLSLNIFFLVIIPSNSKYHSL